MGRAASRLDHPCDGPDGDLGYPATVELSDGSLFTVYYQKVVGYGKCSLLWVAVPAADENHPVVQAADLPFPAPRSKPAACTTSCPPLRHTWHRHSP